MFRVFWVFRCSLQYYMPLKTDQNLAYTSRCLEGEISHRMCRIFHGTLPIWLPIHCPLKKNCVCLMESLKNMPESIETMTDSVRCFENFDHWGDDYKHKRAFSLVEKCHVTSWRSEGQPRGTGDDFLIRLSRNPI